MDEEYNSCIGYNIPSNPANKVTMKHHFQNIHIQAQAHMYNVADSRAIAKVLEQIRSFEKRVDSYR